MNVYIPDPSDYCPGCDRVRCTCPPPGWEERLWEAAYQDGYDAGLADGPDNRPDPDWLRSRWNANRPADADAYLHGYDDGAHGWPNAVTGELHPSALDAPEARGFRPVPVHASYPLPAH